MPAYNKGNVIRAGLRALFGGPFIRGTRRAVFVIVGERPHSRAAGPRVAEGSEKSGKNRDIPRSFAICRILQIANFGEMPDAWKRTGAFEERTIGGNQRAIELHGECQERGVVKGKVKLLADSR
jgi:hypothetical protein